MTRSKYRRNVKPTVVNVLAARYASVEMSELWSAEHKIVLERELWLAVLRAQRSLGMDIPEQVVADYESVIDQVDLASIAERERVTRHDVKARIEEFSALAGHEHIHRGMTSRDLTENVEQLQIRRSLQLVRSRMVDGPRSSGGACARACDDRAHRPYAQRSCSGNHARQAIRRLRSGASGRLGSAG